jgi:hypothetical protein
MGYRRKEVFVMRGQYRVKWQGARWIALLGAMAASVIAVAWGLRQVRSEDRPATAANPLPDHLLQYPGSTLQRVHLSPLPPYEGDVIFVVLMFATDDGQERVANYYAKRLEPYGKVVVYKSTVEGFHGQVKVYVKGTDQHVVIVRAAKSDTDPEDGYTRAKDPKEEETKITWNLCMPIPKWE